MARIRPSSESQHALHYQLSGSFFDLMKQPIGCLHLDMIPFFHNKVNEF
jgi:hypothetical protein